MKFENAIAEMNCNNKVRRKIWWNPAAYLEMKKIDGIMEFVITGESIAAPDKQQVYGLYHSDYIANDWQVFYIQPKENKA